MPPTFGRFVGLGNQRFVPIEDVIGEHLKKLFPGMDVLGAHTFRVTRNEDLEVEEDDAENLLKALEKELQRRRFGPPVRLEVEQSMDPKVLELLVSELGVGRDEVVSLPGPLDLTGLHSIADLPRDDLKYAAFLPTTHPSLAEVESDDAVPAELLRYLVRRYQKVTGEPFPQDPQRQLRGAIQAVFASWDSARARSYREREKIPHDLGTAVNVQVMVFGNRDDRSGTGVGFTRNAATGEDAPYGDFLVNAQGEDVVAGIRNTLDLDQMGERFPEIHDELLAIFDRLEAHYHDMCDTEFTIEQGKLWMLQTRVGKRTGRAALRMAVEMTQHKRRKGWSITRNEAIGRITEGHLDQVLHPQFAAGDREVVATGLGASPGAAVGAAYFSADAAVEGEVHGLGRWRQPGRQAVEDPGGESRYHGSVPIGGGFAAEVLVLLMDSASVGRIASR